MFMVTSLWASTKCFLTWKPKATPHGRLLYQLVPSMRLTEEIESGSLQEMWPTPRASMGMNDSVESAKRQVEAKGYKAKLEQAVAIWPTPTARDYKGGRKPETLAQKGRNETNSLPDAVNAQMGKTGSLNPTWVEWLMGYPEGWTDLKD